MAVDERFSHIAKDPRYKKIPNRKKKVKIDSRFQQMFTDENFNTKYFVDKRGRKVKESANEDLSNFYQLSDEDDEDTKASELHVPDETKRKKAANKLNHKSSGKNAQKKKRKSKQEQGKLENKIRKKMEKKDDTLHEKDGSAAFLTDEERLIGNNINENWHEFGTSAPMTEESTSRLAVCHMDWDKITADDLFVLFHSFITSHGSIQTVKIYPSAYGLERMKREDEIGPTELVASGEASDEDNIVSGDKNAEFNQEKLRQYQLNRLKYYYAVVECDSAETAEKIYEECDGLEYEASSSLLDLRFIPDDMAFDHDPTSVCTALPSAETYKPSEFITTALQQSTVRLTWDETDPRRIQTTMRNFSKDDLLEMDFKAYLASSSSGEDSDEDEDGNEKDKAENEDRKIATYKALLEEIQSNDNENESENEMEVTWDVGLKETTEELVKQKKSEKEQKQLTPWQSYLEEKKRKKRMKQQLKRNKNESQSATPISDDELPSDVDLNDPFFATELRTELRTAEEDSNKKSEGVRKRKKRKGEPDETEEDKRRKAELQLLMMDEDDGKKHFNLKSIMKNEKRKKKKRKDKLDESKKDDFEIDVNDSRFSALYSSHHYAVDPSDPQFRKTKAMETIIQEKQRRSDSAKKNRTRIKENDTTTLTEKPDKTKIDPSLSALIKSVKSNAVKYQDKRKKRSHKTSFI